MTSHGRVCLRIRRIRDHAYVEEVHVQDRSHVRFAGLPFFVTHDEAEAHLRNVAAFHELQESAFALWRLDFDGESHVVLTQLERLWHATKHAVRVMIEQCTHVLALTDSSSKRTGRDAFTETAQVRAKLAEYGRVSAHVVRCVNG